MHVREGINFVGLAAVAAVLACGGRGGDGDAESGSDPFPSSGGDSDPGGTATGDSGDGDGGERFDLGESGSGGSGGAESDNRGCEKVDFLFVIDSSNSMATNQSELIASFPEFVDGIQNTLVDVTSYHVGVVTSDPYAFNESGCTEIGALVTETGGKDSSAQTCGPYAGGARYMTDADDLPTAFSCAAQVGTGGENDEKMVLGAASAVSAPLNAAGACNEGFVRDDALLVMTFITDEDDPGTCINGNQSCDGSPGDPASWAQGFIDIKSGNVENVVVLSLVRGAPGNSCGFPQGTELDGDRIMELTNQFGTNGIIGDICANSFGPFFEQAISVIESACGDFIPPG